MSQIINVGLTANDHTGDPLRDAFIKVNDNFATIDGILADVLTTSSSIPISQVTNLQNVLNSINTSISGLSIDVTSINSSIANINDALASQNISIADLYIHISDLQAQIYTKIEEAPIDGQQYTRKDGGWVVSTGGIPEVPNNAPGTGYVRSYDDITNTFNWLDVNNYIPPSSYQNLSSVLSVGNNLGGLSIEGTVGTNYTYWNPTILRLQDTSNNHEINISSDYIGFLTPGNYVTLRGPATGNGNQFLLPTKSNSTYTLATTVDYTLRNVTALDNTTISGIQFQPVTNTGATGTKFITIQNDGIFLLGTNQMSTYLRNNKFEFAAFGNTLTLSAEVAASSNSANYIFPTKPFNGGTPYTLATLNDITIAALTSGNTNTLTVTGASTSKTIWARGLVSSNGSVGIGTTGATSTTGWAWDLSVLNGLPTGGAAGQILAKNTSTNYDTGWIDNYTSQVKQYVKAGEDLTKGQAVYVSTANGTNMIVSKASNGAEVTSSKTLGLIDSTLALNGFGYVITEGVLGGLDTSTATIGDSVWLGTAGNLLYGIANKPSAPAHMVSIGIVTRVSATVGEIFVKVQNGFELEELHNVQITGLTAGQIISYDGATSLWKNATLNYSTVTGHTEKQAIESLASRILYTDILGISVSNIAPYVMAAISAGTAPIDTTSADPNAFGFISAASAAGANSGWQVSTPNAIFGTLNGGEIFESNISFRSQAGSTTRIGFGNLITVGDHGDGMYFEVTSALNSVTVNAKTAVNSVRTSVSMGTLNTTSLQWYTFRIEVLTVGASPSVKFDVYNTTTGTSIYTTTITTNIPLTFTTAGRALKTSVITFAAAGGTIGLCSIDYLKTILPASRGPLRNIIP
jgi:hypothetical protein